MTDKEFRRRVRAWMRDTEAMATRFARIWQEELGPLRGRVPKRRRARRGR